MANLSPLICLLATVAFTVVSARSPKPNNMKSLHRLGSVDGKSYLVDMETAMNWFEAKEYCKGMNMNLGEITNRVQEEFFRGNSTPTETRYKSYWTGARESRLPREFTWDTSKQGGTQGVLVWRDSRYAEYATCAQLQMSSSSAAIQLARCRNRAYAMCETRVKSE